jgi:aspartokinase
MISNKKIGHSIEKLVYELVTSDMAMQDALYRNYANLSALARLLKDELLKKYDRDASLEAITSALKRSRKKVASFYDKIYPIIARSSISVRTNVAKLSIARVGRATEMALNVLKGFEESFIHISESLTTITLIFDESVLEMIRFEMKGLKILEERTGLAAITVHSPKEIVTTPGCALTIYWTLAKAGVNIEDTTSCYTDTIIVVDMNDVERAFGALTHLVSYSREMV